MFLYRCCISGLTCGPQLRRQAVSCLPARAPHGSLGIQRCLYGAASRPCYSPTATSPSLPPSTLPPRAPPPPRSPQRATSSVHGASRQEGRSGSVTHGSPSSGSPLPDFVSAEMARRGQSTLSTLQGLVDRGDADGAAAYYERYYHALCLERPRPLQYFCAGRLVEVRDVVLLLMRVFVARGRMDKVRELFLAGLRDLGPRAALSPEAAEDESGGSVASHTLATPGVSYLNVNFFNAYLEALTLRKNMDKDEVLFVLAELRAAGLAPSALTYHYLIELHVRAGYDPQRLWEEMRTTRQLTPLPVTLQTLLLRVLPGSSDTRFVMAVLRQAVPHGPRLLDKRMLVEWIERCMRGGSKNTAAAATTASAAGNVASKPVYDHTQVTATNSSTASNATSSSEQAARAAMAEITSVIQPYPAEHILWLMLELELRCVLEKAMFSSYIQKHHLAGLLLRCARGGHVATLHSVFALMDRHAIPKTADLLALAVWCYTTAGALEQALEAIELMSHKGYLDAVDAFRRYTIECLHFTMERNFLLLFVDALTTRALLERALAHLTRCRTQHQPEQQNNHKGDDAAAKAARMPSVSVHALDLIVLAAAKLGEERLALHLVASYMTDWSLAPRTNTYNSLLVGCSSRRGTALHRTIYEAMLKNGVAPNAQTFRVLTRQAAYSDNIDDAMYYLREVTHHPGLRVEVDMILPIFERATRAGDAETVCRVSQYALDCDIGIDPAVLHAAITRLTEAGHNVDVMKSHLPLHEALRSRSKVGRQRARSELVL